MVHIERTPLSDIKRAAVYENTRKLSLGQIVEEQKPDIAMTAVFYSAQWKPVCPVKADGKVLYADAQYNYWAMAWSQGPDAGPELIRPGGVSASASYAANCVLITGGTPHEKLYYNADVGGKRGRVAVGLTNSGEWLTFASTDGSPSALTPEELRDYMARQDCRFAIMMDGGRKVNLYVRRAGVMMEGKDPSQTLILLWLNKDSGEEDGAAIEEDDDMFKIALSAGHGINTAGKRCMKALDPNETREWWLNDRICDYVEDALKDYGGYELLRLDDSDGGEDNPTLAARVTAANQWGADFYLSVHHNAGVNGGSGGGIVAYVCPGASGASKEWQGELYGALIDHTGLKGNRSQPKAEGNYYVLKNTAMPAVLLELGFMDSSTDVPIILTDEYARQCAAAIVEVIVKRAGLARQAAAPAEGDALYKVQVGAFSKKENADALQAELAAKGYPVYMVRT